MSVAIVVVCVVLFMLINSRRVESMQNRPSQAERAMMARQLMAVRSDFDKADGLDRMKSKLDWIDPVVYEDLRRLHIDGMLSDRSIDQLLSSY